MISGGSKSVLRYAVTFGVVGSVLALLLITAFYTAKAKEGVYPFLYYFGWLAVQLSSVLLQGVEKTGPVARVYDVLYVLFTGLQWAIIGTLIRLVLFGRRAARS